MSLWDKVVDFKELVGVTLQSVEKEGDDQIRFTAVDGREWLMNHEQDCCESVSIESIVGDLSDLVGEPILVAEEVTSDTDPADSKLPEGYRDYRESFTWTFYKLATRKGYVDIRWYGESNGYYSESVYFARVSEATQ